MVKHLGKFRFYFLKVKKKTSFPSSDLLASRVNLFSLWDYCYAVCWPSLGIVNLINFMCTYSFSMGVFTSLKYREI